MPAEKLTDAKIAAKIKKKQPFRLWDNDPKGLCLWLRKGGKPRWYVFVRHAGKMRSIAVSDGLNSSDSLNLADARKLAKQVITDLANENDPVEARIEARVEARIEAQGGKVPFADILDEHLALLVEKGRAEQHRQEVERIAKLAIAEAKISDLTSEDCSDLAREWLENMDVSDSTRMRYRRHLIAIGMTAVRKRPASLMPRNPFIGLTGHGVKLPTPPYFEPAEAIAIASDAALILEHGRLFAFLLYTGCRLKEATWARWEDSIDIEAGSFYIVPPNEIERAQGARVKRDKSRTVAIPDELLTLLKQWEKGKKGKYLFPAEWRGKINPTRAFRKYLEELGLPIANRHIHSLRHTRVTIGRACGERDLDIRSNIGHAGSDMTAHYSTMANGRTIRANGDRQGRHSRGAEGYLREI